MTATAATMDVSAQEAARKRRKKARIASMIAGRPRIGPQTVHFDLVNACNTRCTTCWHHSPVLEEKHRPTAAWKRQRMPLPTFVAIFDDLVALGGLEQIILSGMGDPTLHPHLYEMVEYAHQHQVGVTIITNLLTADIPRLMASPGELHLLTSICGVSEPVWQDFHAHPGKRGYGQLIDQLRALRSHGFAAKHVQVINGQNFHQLVEMVRFGERFPVERINFKFASLQRGTERYALSRQEKEKLVYELIPAAQALAGSLGVDTDLAAFSSQVNFDCDDTADMADIGCFMGYLYCRITVENELLYCCNTNVSVGFLDEETSFADLWNGGRYQGLRQYLRGGRYFKGCNQCGKYKQNVKWSAKLREKLAPQVFAKIIGKELV